MRRATIEENRRCPKCGQAENQINKGRNRSGTQRRMCKKCGVYYTLDPKKAGVSRRDKAACDKNLLCRRQRARRGEGSGDEQIQRVQLDQKNDEAVDNSYEKVEMDELYWFIESKPRTKTHENVYLLTMVTRQPRIIVGMDVAFYKSPQRIQALVDSASAAESYCTDGYLGYMDVAYPGKHVRNIRNKSDTYT